MPHDPFYRSQAWRLLRAAVLRRDNHRCAICRREGSHVDHIVSRSRRPDLALNAANLRVLCHSCHSHKTVRQDGGFGRKGQPESSGCTADGEPRDAGHHWNK